MQTDAGSPVITTLAQATRSLPSELDGFVTGILVAPAAIGGDEWTNVLLASFDPDLTDTPEKRHRIRDMLLRHHDELAADLDGRASFRPVFETGSDGTIIWETWLRGFCRSMPLRDEAWMGFVRDAAPTALAALEILMLFHELESGSGEFSEAEADLAQAQAPGLIPDLVLLILKESRKRVCLGDLGLQPSARVIPFPRRSASGTNR